MPTISPQEVGQETGSDTFSRRSELEFRRLLEILPAGAYTCDAQGLITFYNEPAVRLWGRAPKLNDPADRYCGSYKLFTPSGTPLPHEECWMGCALKQNREFNGYEIVIERPDGTRRIALAHADPIRGEWGEVVGGVNVLVDITQCKQTEDTLKQVEFETSRLVTKGVDDLRNALAPIRTAIKILHLRSGPEPELRWALEIMDRQIRQLAQVVDDLEHAVSRR